MWNGLTLGTGTVTLELGCQYSKCLQTGTVAQLVLCAGFGSWRHKNEGSLRESPSRETSYQKPLRLIARDKSPAAQQY